MQKHVHICKTHENEKDKEGKKKEISDDNVAHKDADENSLENHIDASRNDIDSSYSSHCNNHITQKIQCGTCGDKFTEDNESENHIAQEHEFNKSGLRFADENSLEDHTFEGHKFTCEQLRDKNMTDSYTNKAQEDAMLEEDTDNDDGSSKDATDSEEVFPYRDETLTASYTDQALEGAMLRKCTDDDMEETPRGIDEEEENRDIFIKSESLVSIDEGSSRD